MFEHAKTLENADQDLGIALGFLVLDPNLWIHRKVDALMFTGDMRLRRQVSVDFQVPSADYGVALAGDSVLVPLAVFQKDLLLGFDLRDEAGSSMPVLTTAQNVWVAWSILVAMATAALDDDASPLTVEEVRALRDVASASADKADSVLASLVDHPRLQSLIQNPLLYAGLSTLAANFLLITMVDPEIGPRRVVKYSYDVDLSDQTNDFSWRARLGLVPATVDIEMSRLDCYSHHVEVRSPLGLQFAADPEVSVSSGSAPMTVRTGHNAAVAHAHIETSEYSLSPVPSARVGFGLFATDHGLVRAAALLGLLVVLLLVGALIWPESLVSARSSADAAAAPILALIGVFTLFVVRPGEHQFVAHLLVPYRLLVVFVGVVVPFVMAVSLILVPLSDHALLWTWFGLLVSSEVSVAILWLVWLRATKLWRTP
jgi:hypothetical protein